LLNRKASAEHYDRMGDWGEGEDHARDGREGMGHKGEIKGKNERVGERRSNARGNKDNARPSTDIITK